MNAVRLPEPDPRRRRQARIVIPTAIPIPAIPARIDPPPQTQTTAPPRVVQEPRPLTPPLVLLTPAAEPTPLFLALVRARRALTGVLTLSLVTLAVVYMSTVQVQSSWATDYKALNQIRQQTRQMQTATGLLEGNLAKETNHPAPFEPARPERVVLLPLLSPEPTKTPASSESTPPLSTEPVTIPLGY
jgi:hypothetical protein